jgi:dipeptidyl aminopeptidase/acylaminoacyl peptidase
MRPTPLACLLVACATAQAAIPVPERALTDPNSIVSPANAQALAVPIDDLAVTRGILDAAWSVDGKFVFISTNLTGRYNLWRVDTAGSWPVQLAQSDDIQGDPSPSPDGKTLLFTQDVGGNEYYDVYSVPTGGGAVVQLTATPDVQEDNPRFSPDGRSVSLEIKPKSGSVVNVAVMDLQTRQVRQLTHEKAPDQNWQVVGWAPDGQSIVANRGKVDASESNVWRIDVATGDVQPITNAKAGVYVAATTLSSDGRLLAISSNEATGQKRAGIYDLAKRAYRWLKPTPWEQYSGQFSPDGSTLVTRTSEDGRSTLALVDVATGTERALAFPPGYNREATSLTPSFAPGSKQLLVLHSGANTPFDIWIANVASGENRALTRLAMASLDPDRLPRSQIVTFTSFDGTLISAIVTIPFNLKRDGSNPAVVLPHGGPTGQAEDYFSKTAAALASRGYMVIQPNFRGSTGYGQAFQMANVGDLGGGDLKDTLAAKDFLVATGYVDPKKVGITGGSYGGFMTLMAIGRAPDAFGAAVQYFGIINWHTMYETSDPILQQYLIALLGDPIKDKAKYDASSPMTYIRQVKAPLLSLQGENDIRVPRGQAQEVADTLKAKGTEVETIFYPAEGHGFAKRENQIDALRRSVAWFDKHLKKQEPPK